MKRIIAAILTSFALTALATEVAKVEVVPLTKVQVSAAKAAEAEAKKEDFRTRKEEYIKRLRAADPKKADVKDAPKKADDKSKVPDKK